MVKYKVGTEFEIDGNKVVLCNVDTDRITLMDTVTWNRYVNPIDADVNDITDWDIQELLGEDTKYIALTNYPEDELA